MLIFSLYWSLLLISCGLTAWYGGRDGRYAAAIVAASSAANLAAWLLDHHIVYAWTFPAACDLIQLLLFADLMRRSRRWWPVWLTGFQIDAVVAHLAGAFAPDHAAAVFRGLHTFWGTPILIVMLVGTMRDRRAALRGGDFANVSA